MKKDKKNIIIIILSVLIIAVSLFLFIKYKKYDITFTLNGEDIINIEYGTDYVDPGFVAKNGLGKDISDNVLVSSEVNPTISGNYEIIYSLLYGNVEKQLTRKVIVGIVDINKLNIVLNGDETVYLVKGSKYKDEGAYVVNSINNEIFELGTMNITNNIDANKTGTYSVDYTFVYNNQSINRTRKVEVFDIDYNISPDTLTTGKVKISINLESINNYSNTKLPDGTTSLYKNITYDVSKNGDYTFIITLKDNTKYEKVVTIDNIIDNYKCTGTITNTGTKIFVSPTSNNIKEYEWVINNKTINGKSTYEEYKIINNAKVNLVLTNGRKHQVNCVIEDKLVYHFKYDLENTGTWLKPEMQCNTYTSADKTKYDKILKQLVEEAGGKGSRGGAVAAIRYLIGGLDYRIRYQAPRATDSTLGKYQKEGLNIGNSKAWGCRVGGYRNGFDCTHFVEWALAQVGIIRGAYSYPTKETSKVIDSIKPGDVLYVKGGSGLSHVALVAGINKDRSIFYIAESVPGSGNQDIGVTLHATKRSTVLSAYKLVGTVPYTKEGTVTDMWLME